MKHLVVIPTYNEIENIEDMIRELFSLYPSVSVLVMDDSSPDGTANKVKSLQEEFKNLHLIIQEKKGGLANAYINGFKWGLKEGFDLFTSIDADFSHKPMYIADAIKLINEGADVACGARYMKGGNTTEKHWFRNLISIGGNIWVNFVLGTNLYDILEGFNTYSKKVLEKIDLNSIGSKGYIFGAEMKYRAIKSGFRLIEFPIYFDVRQKGKSKMSFDIISEALFFVMLLRFRKNKK